MIALDMNSPIVTGGDFKWKEYCLLRFWNAYAAPKNEQYVKNAIFLFENIQTLIRGPLGVPISISSGARTDEYTAYLRRMGIPAAPKSAHNSWEGVDLEPPHGMKIDAFWKYCDSVWPGRIELAQYTKSWVHLDTRLWGKRVRFAP